MISKIQYVYGKLGEKGRQFEVEIVCDKEMGGKEKRLVDNFVVMLEDLEILESDVKFGIWWRDR